MPNLLVKVRPGTSAAFEETLARTVQSVARGWYVQTPAFSFPIEPGDWRLDPARGGGALWDVGCYGLSSARLFSGAEPAVVQKAAREAMRELDPDLPLYRLSTMAEALARSLDERDRYHRSLWAADAAAIAA